MGNWQNLQSVSIYSSATQPVLNALNSLKGLRNLKLVKPIVDPEAPCRQPFLGRLQELGVISRSDSIVRRLAGSHNLQSLILRNGSISPDTLQELHRCPNLQWLSLQIEGKTITDQIVRAIVQIKSLRGVTLHNNVSTEQIRTFGKCPWITQIVLYGNNYSDSERANLKALDSRIKFDGTDVR